MELAVVVVIIGILATMLLPIYAGYRERSEESRCLANLRSLYNAASSYLLQSESWPQIPVKWVKDNPKGYARAWVSTLTPFGAPHQTWLCPTIQRSMGVSLEDVMTKDEHYRIDFVAGFFDDNPTSPRLADSFPWFVEKSGVHGRGNLFIQANGITGALQDIAGGP